jgi:hypothetical protein
MIYFVEVLLHTRVRTIKASRNEHISEVSENRDIHFAADISSLPQIHGTPHGTG